jgi:hypothetical protein
LAKGNNSGRVLAKSSDANEEFGDSFEDQFVITDKDQEVVNMDSDELSLPPLSPRVSAAVPNIGQDVGNGESLVSSMSPLPPRVSDAGDVGMGNVNPGVNEDDPGPGGGEGDHGSGVGEDDPGPGGGSKPAGEKDMGPGDGGVPALGSQMFVIDRIDPVLLCDNSRSQLSITESSVLGGRGVTLDSSLERIFGTGATRLDIEFEGMANVESVHNMSDMSSGDGSSLESSSTPNREGQTKKRLRGGDGASFGNLSSISGEDSSSGEESEEEIYGDLKKQKLGDSEKEFSAEEAVKEIDGEMESQHSVGTEQMQVSPGVGPGSEQEPVHVSVSQQVPEEP